MSGYNVTGSATGNYNAALTPVVTRPSLPRARFEDGGGDPATGLIGLDGGNSQLASALRVVRINAIEALTPLVGAGAAEAGAVAAEHALAAAFGTLRCNFRSAYLPPGIHDGRNTGTRPLTFGAGFRRGIIAAYDVLVTGSGDPMTTGRAAVAALNETRTVETASLVVVEAFAQACTAGARAALAASKV